MAELERAGYLRIPHTSAGRVPTDAGYRLYVESISDAVTLAPVEQLMIRHQFGQVEFASEQWFRLAASTLAGTTHSAGLATPAKPDASRLRRVDLVETGDRLASLVLVLAEGAVKQVLMPLDASTDQAGLDDVARRLNERLAGLAARGDDAPSSGPCRSTTDATAWPRASASASSEPCASSMPRPSTTSSARACST